MGSFGRCERLLFRRSAIRPEDFSLNRFCHLARIVRRELKLADDFGVHAKALLQEGRTEDARRVAWGAFCHWRNARRALRRLDPCSRVFSERTLPLSA